MALKQRPQKRATLGSLGVWYRPANYHPLRQLKDEVGWFLQFAVRRECRELIATETDGFCKPLTSEVFAHRLARQIEHSPLVCLKDIANLGDTFGILCLKSIVEMFHLDSPTKAAVHATTVDELMAVEFVLAPEFRKVALAFYEEVSPPANAQALRDPQLLSSAMSERAKRIYLKKYFPLLYPAYVERAKWSGPEYRYEFGSPLYHHQEAFLDSVLLSARLDLPDDLLIEQFKATLRTARKYVSKSAIRFSDRGKRFEAQRERWIKLRVLQFIDLQTWNLSTCSGLSNAGLWRAILSHDEHQPVNSREDSNLRKTNTTVAEEMMAPFSQDFRILESRAAAILSADRWNKAVPTDLNAVFEEQRRRQYRKKQT